MVALSERDFQRIRDTAQAVVAEEHLPGIASGVVAGEEFVFNEGFGYAGGLPMLPADPDDAAFFAVQPPGRERTHIVLARDASGRVDGLRCDELYHFVRRDLPAD